MDDIATMNVLYCTKNGAYESGSITESDEILCKQVSINSDTHASVYCPLAHMLSKSSPPVHRSKQRYRLWAVYMTMSLKSC